MSNSNDQTDLFQQSVHEALKSKIPLQIEGGGSKAFYGRTPQGAKLLINDHHGIVNYHPSELVLTVRAGTLLSEIEKKLAEQGQMLAFEPPYFSPSATIGGAVACGFSGARRPFAGAVRDFVLGCKIIDGKGDVLSFGGEVMKNVAGYDVSRLMVGAMGTLGLILEVSVKVLPKPDTEVTQVFELTISEAIAQMSNLSKKSLPLSGLTFTDGLLYVRLSGTGKAVMAATAKVGGEKYENTKAFWQDCQEQQCLFFQSSEDLWRLSVPPALPELSLSGEWFYEWGGAQRWLKTTELNQTVFTLAEEMEGHAVLFKARDRSSDVFQALPQTLKKLHRNVKIAFDPEGIFNPYRLYKEW